MIQMNTNIEKYPIPSTNFQTNPNFQFPMKKGHPIASETSPFAKKLLRDTVGTSPLKRGGGGEEISNFYFLISNGREEEGGDPRLGMFYAHKFVHKLSPEYRLTSTALRVCYMYQCFYTALPFDCGLPSSESP